MTHSFPARRSTELRSTRTGSNSFARSGPARGRSNRTVTLEGRAAALEALAQGRGAVVWQRLIADVETPVSAALKLIEPGRGDWVLESVESGETRGRMMLISPEIGRAHV